MTLRKGAETIVNQCLNLSEDEKAVVVNDVNDPDLIKALMEVVKETTDDYLYLEYPESENHGEEPPEIVADALKSADVFIAPSKKSISHTQARIKANEAGARGATLPGINKEVWNSSLQADYEEVKQICDRAFEILEEDPTVRIETPSGTDLEMKVYFEDFDKDIGLIHESGEFGNLPAGEIDGGVLEVNGELVIDHIPFVPDRNEGAKVEIRDNQVVAVESDDAEELAIAFDDIENSRNIAEFGFGTNPEASLIGNILQDEKVLGTIHIAFGDNTSYFPEGHERYMPCEIHWDVVCEKPTVWFGDTKVLDEGEPVFLDR